MESSRHCCIAGCERLIRRHRSPHLITATFLPDRGAPDVMLATQKSCCGLKLASRPGTLLLKAHFKFWACDRVDKMICSSFSASTEQGAVDGSKASSPLPEMHQPNGGIQAANTA